MQEKKQTKGKIELRVTEEEKILLKTMAAKRGKNVNKYVLDLVKKDKEENLNELL